MPHRLSLVRRTAELRRLYTGETDSTLLPIITQGLGRLSSHERATIAEVLDQGYETRLLGENPFSTLDQRFRDVLLADATDTVQQQLEAGILFALGQIASHHWPETDVVAPMPVCRMVRPVRDAGEMSLHLHAGVLAPMMAVLTPHVVNGRVRGLAGLRATVHRRHIQLHLADGGTAGTVALSNTSHRQWAAALTFAEQVISPEQRPAVDSHLTADERAVIHGGRVPGPVALASALLRRLRVLGDTFWLTVRTDGHNGMRLDWAGGRSAAHVAAALVHPLTGLAGERFSVTRVADGSVTIIVTAPSGEPTAKLTLHQAPLTATPPFARIDVSAAWAEFRRVLQAPNPMLPQRGCWRHADVLVDLTLTTRVGSARTAAAATKPASDNDHALAEADPARHPDFAPEISRRASPQPDPKDRHPPPGLHRRDRLDPDPRRPGSGLRIQPTAT